MSTSPRRANPALRQTAFDGPFSTDGKACMKRYFPSARARSATTAVALVATPRLWYSGNTLQPVSQTRPSRHSVSQYPAQPAAPPDPATITNVPPPPAALIPQ